MSHEDTQRHTKTDEKCWARIIAFIEARLNRPSYNTWVRPCQLGAITRTALQVLAPNSVSVYWLSEHYTGLFSAAFAAVWGTPPTTVIFEVRQ